VRLRVKPDAVTAGSPCAEDLIFRRLAEGAHFDTLSPEREGLPGASLEEFLDMCDYSLQSILSRPAKVGDKLTTRNFGTGTCLFGAAALFNF
jgi:hypothetical protein